MNQNAWVCFAREARNLDGLGVRWAMQAHKGFHPRLRQGSNASAKRTGNLTICCEADSHRAADADKVQRTRTTDPLSATLLFHPYGATAEVAALLRECMDTNSSADRGKVFPRDCGNHSGPTRGERSRWELEFKFFFLERPGFVAPPCGFIFRF